MRRFQLMASTIGTLVVLTGCGAGYPSTFPGSVPGSFDGDFGELGPPAYREQPPSQAPDFTMLPPPAQQPVPVPSTPAPPWNPSPTPAPGYPTPAPPQPAPTQPTAPPVGDSQFLGQLEEAILQMVNEERAKVGAKALAMETMRRDVARAHSLDMAARNFFDHTNPDGKSPFDRMRSVGISYTTAGENIAYNTYPVDRAARAAFDGWMNSEGHRKNIQNANYGRTGIGVYRNPGNGRVYLTQVFTN